ncbi:peptidase T [Baekduia alba]|uniref:peptidase T n=1 Tax=Baekduia alba TaxID=2997333 RepID=UPI002341906C|nr:peptidase T [Baekduia alba]
MPPAMKADGLSAAAVGLASAVAMLGLGPAIQAPAQTRIGRPAPSRSSVQPMSLPYSSALAEALAPGLLERFERYVRIESTAGRHRTQSPSTPGQLELGRLLVDELKAAGVEDASVDDNGYVVATLPATVEDAPVIGLIAHVDTSPDAPGAGVEPIVHRDYDGSVIALPRGGTVLDPASVSALGDKVGHDVITSSGDTLLGADDKAGVAEIVTAVAYLAQHPELPRPTLRVCFTPDEEIGEGATLFDVEAFGAYGAYTLDGSELGELQEETFTAAEVKLTIHGVDIHPGFAKDILVNAARLAAQVVAALPSDRLTPETTDGRDGYIHPYELGGDAQVATVTALVRDFDDDLLQSHIDLIRTTAEEVVGAQPRARLEVDVHHQYPNMKAHLAPFPEVVAAAERAIAAEGLEAKRTVIRGGTDGSRLSAMGLPTPNIFTGGHEFHSVREWASLHDMASAAAVIVHLAEAWTQDDLRRAATREAAA